MYNSLFRNVYTEDIKTGEGQESILDNYHNPTIVNKFNASALPVTESTSDELELSVGASVEDALLKLKDDIETQPSPEPGEVSDEDVAITDDTANYIGIPVGKDQAYVNKFLYEQAVSGDEVFTAGEDIEAGGVCYISPDDGLAYLAANDNDTCLNKLHISTLYVGSGQDGIFIRTGYVATSGQNDGIGYLGANGSITSTQPTDVGTYIIQLGYIFQDFLEVNIDPTVIKVGLKPEINGVDVYTGDYVIPKYDYTIVTEEPAGVASGNCTYYEDGNDKRLYLSYTDKYSEYSGIQAILDSVQVGDLLRVVTYTPGQGGGGDSQMYSRTSKVEGILDRGSTSITLAVDSDLFTGSDVFEVGIDILKTEESQVYHNSYMVKNFVTGVYNPEGGNITILETDAGDPTKREIRIHSENGYGILNPEVDNIEVGDTINIQSRLSGDVYCNFTIDTITYENTQSELYGEYVNFTTSNFVSDSTFDLPSYSVESFVSTIKGASSTATIAQTVYNFTYTTNSNPGPDEAYFELGGPYPNRGDLLIKIGINSSIIDSLLARIAIKPGENRHYIILRSTTNPEANICGFVWGYDGSGTLELNVDGIPASPFVEGENVFLEYQVGYTRQDNPTYKQNLSSFNRVYQYATSALLKLNSGYALAGTRSTGPSTSAGLFLSTDNGLTFKEVGILNGHDRIANMIQLPSGLIIITAISSDNPTGASIYTFDETTESLGEIVVTSSAGNTMGLACNDTNRLYVGTGDNGSFGGLPGDGKVYYSDDEGVSFTGVSVGTEVDILGIKVLPTGRVIVIALASSGVPSIYYSDTNGESFIKSTFSATGCVFGRIEYLGDNRVVVGASNSGQDYVYISDDNGVSFTRNENFSTFNLSDMKVLSSGRLVVTSDYNYEARVVYSDDRGLTYTNAETNVSADNRFRPHCVSELESGRVSFGINFYGASNMAGIAYNDKIIYNGYFDENIENLYEISAKQSESVLGNTAGVESLDTRVEAIEVSSFRYYNDTGATIKAGQVIHLKSATEYQSELIATAELADYRYWEKVQGSLYFAVADCETGVVGYGADSIIELEGFDTSAWSAGSQLWLAENGDLTDVEPVYPNFSISCGGNYNQAVDGKVFLNFTSDFLDVFSNAWIGSVLQGFNFTVSSDGTTVKGLLENKDNTRNLTLNFGGLYELDTTTTPVEVNLVAGTDENEILNYVYIPKSTKVLTVSTTGYPADEPYVQIAEVIVQSAASVQADGGASANQNINNHLTESSGIGHLIEAFSWIRDQNSTYKSGCKGSLDSTGGNGYISVTSGVVKQFHEQVFNAISMPTDFVRIVNDPTTTNRKTTNLNTINAYSTGSSWNNNWANVVIWGVANKTGEPNFIRLNLPSDGYNSEADAMADRNNYTNYSIPQEFKGRAFLIARFTVRIASGSITYNPSTGYQDLTGTVPNNIAGGGGAGGATTYLELDDTESTYTGYAGHVAKVNDAETATEWEDLALYRKLTNNTFDDFNSNFVKSWTKSEVGSSIEFVLAITQLSTGRVLISTGSDTGDGDIYYSDNFGISWTKSEIGSTIEEVWAISQLSTGRVLIGTGNSTNDGDIYYSDDFGLTWTKSEIGSNIEKVYSIAQLSTGRVLIGTGSSVGDGDVYYSDDYGISWTKSEVGSTIESVWAISQLSTGRVLIGTGDSTDDGDVYYSDDFGLTWTTSEVGSAIERIYSIVQLSTGRVLIGTGASTNDGDIYYSDDFGITWTKSEIGSTIEEVWSITQLSTGRVLIGTGAGTGDGDIYYSDDFGISWTKSEVGSTIGRVFVITQLSTGRVMIGTGSSTDDGDVYYSDDISLIDNYKDSYENLASINKKLIEQVNSLEARLIALETA